MKKILALIVALFFFSSPVQSCEAPVCTTPPETDIPFWIWSLDTGYTYIPEAPEQAEEPEEYQETAISEEDIALLALLTMAEAEGEPEEGKRLVIDTVLNRVDSPYFPDTINEVIYQPNQFTSMWNGRADRCEVREDICQLVCEELESRTDTEVIFFTSVGYSAYGVPMFQLGGHYFSSYEEATKDEQ